MNLIQRQAWKAAQWAIRQSFGTERGKAIIAALESSYINQIIAFGEAVLNGK